jgi:hypothetical protein
MLYLFGGVPGGTNGTDTNLNDDDGCGTFYQYLATNTYLTQAGGSAQRSIGPFVGPFPHLYMFADSAGTYFHMVLEFATGDFRHLTVGNLVKYGTWTGGGYYSAMYWDPSLDISIPSGGNNTVLFDNNTSAAGGQPPRDWTVHYVSPTSDLWIAPNGDNILSGSTVQRRQARGSVRGGFNRAFKNIAESLFSGQIPLAPIVIGAVRQSDTPNTIRFIGEVPDIRMVNMTNLAAAGEFAIGSDTWKCFPFAQKNGSAGTENSGVGGLAYKKLP